MYAAIGKSLNSDLLRIYKCRMRMKSSSILMSSSSQSKRKIPDNASITAHVGIGQIPGGFGLDIDLHVSLPGLAQEEAQSLVDAAHQVCPYSNATRGNVDVRLHVNV